nr:zinc finger, CCHC-type [Tanacetum cinerariifolium]
MKLYGFLKEPSSFGVSAFVFTSRCALSAVGTTKLLLLESLSTAGCGLCVDYTDARIVGICNNGSNTNKDKVESTKELWDSLESKYMAKDSSSKKFLDFKHSLKHGKDHLSLVQLGSHLRIEESLRAQDSDKGKGKKRSNENNSGSSSNKKPKLNVESVVRLVTSKGIIEVVKRTTQLLVVDAIAWWIDSGATTYVCKDSCWYKTYEPVEDGSVLYMGDDHFAPIHGHVHYKRMLEMSKDDLIPAIDKNPEKCTTSRYTPQQNGVAERKNRALKKMGCRAVVRLPDPKRKTLDEKGIDCIFVGYAEHSREYRFYIIEPNDSVSINSIIESRDAIFGENRFSSIPRPNDIIPNSYESQTDDHSDDVPNEIPKPCKGCKWIFKRKMKVDGTVDKFKARLFSMKDMGEADVILGIKIKRKNKEIVITQSDYIEKILKKFNREYCSPVSTPIDPVEKLNLNTGKPVDQLKYSRAIGCLMYAMISTRPDIAYAVGRLKAYSDASWINHVEDSSSTSGWVFLLGGGAISWASKKLTCITGSTMKSEFVALAAAGKEAEWIRNLIHEIPIWPKPITSISIRCDSAPTMARGYSQIYNWKSRHLGVRHYMVRELIRNGVISIEFVWTQHNLADHLTNGLARDLVYKSVIGMGFKSIQIYYI